MKSTPVKSRARWLRAGASTIVLASAVLAPMPAFAQEVTDPSEEVEPLSQQTDPDAAASPEPESPDDNTIIVTGTRRAAQTSINIKRNADTVVDSITATDIGAFPDKSVAEALQRVPGVTVNRFAATSDTAHFSAEPSGVIVRGLPQVRSEFNGRDTFSANSSRGLSWGDVTPELMAGVDTYKNQYASLIEGGIAGSINLRTRVPFDASGQLFQVGANMNFNDLSKRWTPDANVFYSNRLQTGFGEIGAMANVAFSRVVTASQGMQYGRAAIIDNGFGPTGPATAYIPASINFLDNEYDRRRLGMAFAGQWKSNDDRWLLTTQFNRSTYKNEWEERSFGAFGIGPDLYGLDVRTRLVGNGGNLDERIPVPAPGTPAFTFDRNGFFQTGTPIRSNAENSFWWGNIDGSNVGFGVNDQGAPMFNACYNWGASPNCVRNEAGIFGYAGGVGTGSRLNQNKNMTQDIAANLKWEATDRLQFNFDGQYVKSRVDNYDISVEHHSFADVTLDANGRFPRIELAPPTNVNQSAGGLSNPNNWYLRSVMDHLEDSDGKQWAFRGDGEYDLDTDWLQSLSFGARTAMRDQTVRWSTYNWANVANTWTDTVDPTVVNPATGLPCVSDETFACPTIPHPYWNLDRTSPYAYAGPDGIRGTADDVPFFAGYPSGMFEVSEFGAPFLGGTLGSFPFVPRGALRDRQADLYSRDLTGVGEFRPICTRLNELPDSCFVNSEIADVSEDTKAVYAMLRFGGPDAQLGSVGISGNVGVRYVNTRNESRGFLQFPVNNYNFNQCDGQPPQPGPGQPPPPPGTPVDPAHCFLSDEDLVFISGGGTESTAAAKHKHWLPSFNLRADITPQWLVRFAASRAMSRPDMGLLKNFVAVSAGLPNATAIDDPRWVRNSAGEVVGVNPTYQANAYNPYLKPTTAWQFDVSLEHYFGNAGLFSVALFQKKFSDYIQYGLFNLDVERDGVVRNVQVRGPANGEGATIRGLELAYNRFFDFLPDPLDGLGIQTNYTFVHNKGVPNSALTPVGSTGGAQTNEGNAGTALNPGSLEGLSKHAFNLVGLYEKNKIAARLAYNWRSKYLVTVVDCCVYLPVWQEGAGFLDGSIRYALTNQIELSLQGSNLLNTRTKLLQQVADEESPEGRVVTVPNAWFQNDRRIMVGARYRLGN